MDMLNGTGGAVEVVFEQAEPACREFMGFGVEWDPGVARLGNPEATLTDADWELVLRRIDWMRIPVIRMMMQAKWCYKGGGRYDYDCPEMRLLYRHLEACQKRGIKVILTDWGCEPNWLRIPDVKDFADPLYAEIVGTYMEHLLNIRGYDCIKYFVLGNEPNGEVRDFARWRRGVEQVWTQFERRGVLAKVGIAGSDESDNQGWHRQALDVLSDKLAAYDIHRYARHNAEPDVDELRSGRLYELLEAEWGYALAVDPEAPNKPTMVGEAGIVHDGFNAGNNPCHREFLYGLKMADYAAQAVGAGSSLVSAWMLDDSSHASPNQFNWGMWENKEGAFALKPWFYPWSLLCRLIPAGSTMYRAACPVAGVDFAAGRRFFHLSGVSPTPSLRAMAARSNDAARPGWTIWLVNRGAEPVTVRLQVRAGGRSWFAHYVYAEGNVPADRDGMPIPLKAGVDDLDAGITVVCPAKAAYFVSSV